jgi:DNA polymerase V
MRSNQPIPFSDAPADVFQLSLFPHRPVGGFPSPAEDHLEEPINLHAYAVRNPAATFFMWVAGSAMAGEGVFNGDLAVVDCSLSAKQGDMVVAEVEGEFTLRRFHRVSGAVHLRSASLNYPTIVVTPEMDARVFGVVTYVLRHLSKGRRR